MLFVACAAPHALPVTAAARPNEQRHPPAIAVDPELGGLEPTSVADINVGLVALRSPHPVERARAAVDAFFQAVVNESPRELARLLSAEAEFRSPSTGTVLASSYWNARLDRFDYTTLRGTPLFRSEAVEVFQDTHTVDTAAGPLPTQAAGEEVLVRVPVDYIHLGKDRWFGDEVWFLLRPTPAGYRIHEILEDFGTP